MTENRSRPIFVLCVFKSNKYSHIEQFHIDIAIINIITNKNFKEFSSRNRKHQAILCSGH
jgi:hypothetical protein